MIIVGSNNIPRFHQLKPGDIFGYDERAYSKTVTLGVAMDLSNGQLETFKPDTMITPYPNATLILQPN